MQVEAPSGEAQAQRAEIRGIVVGQEGQPLDGVTLEFHRGDPVAFLSTPQARRGKTTAPIVTDAEGRFAVQVSPAPKLDCFFRWSGDGVEPGASGWLAADLLDDELRFVAVERRPFHGRLMGADGQPVIEAEVRLRRDAETVTTNDRGEFRLDRVPETPAPLLVRDASGKLDWALIRASDGWTDVVFGHAPPTAAFQPPVLSKAELQELATELRERWLDAAIRANDYIDMRWRLIDLAKLDLDGALQRLDSPAVTAMFQGAKPGHFHNRSWCGTGIERYDSHVADGVDLKEYVRAQLKLVADPKDTAARAQYEAMVTGPPRSLMIRASLGLWLPRTVEGEATPLERAAQAISDAESKPMYGRVVTYSRTALSLLGAGEQEEAERVMGLARAIVAPGNTPSYLSDGYIRALCHFDLEAGLELIRAKRKSRESYAGLLEQALRLVPIDLDKAVSLLHEAVALPKPRYGSSYAPASLHRVIYAVAQLDGVRAESLASRYDETGYSFGLIALARSRGLDSSISAEECAQQVRRLLDRAFDQAARDVPLRQRTRRTISLLRIARHADEANLEEWLNRTLWNSLPQSGVSSRDPMLAWIVRDHAPRLAEALAFSAARRAICGDSFHSEMWSVASYFDPRRAADLALRDGASGLEHTSNALLRSPAGLRENGSWGIGSWYPRSL